MQEATFLVLTALADGSQHGYGIITEVRQISGGRVKLRAGTLYSGPGPATRGRADRRRPRRDRGGPAAPLLPADPRRTAVLAEEAARLHANATAALRRLNPGLAGGAA